MEVCCYVSNIELKSSDTPDTNGMVVLRTTNDSRPYRSPGAKLLALQKHPFQSNITVVTEVIIQSDDTPAPFGATCLVLEFLFCLYLKS